MLQSLPGQPFSQRAWPSRLANFWPLEAGRPFGQASRPASWPSQTSWQTFWPSLLAKPLGRPLGQALAKPLGQVSWPNLLAKPLGQPLGQASWPAPWRSLLTSLLANLLAKPLGQPLGQAFCQLAHSYPRAQNLSPSYHLLA